MLLGKEEGSLEALKAHWREGVHVIGPIDDVGWGADGPFRGPLLQLEVCQLLGSKR